MPLDEVYLWLCRHYGWTYDYVKEMSEMEIFNAILVVDKHRYMDTLKAVNDASIIEGLKADNRHSKHTIRAIQKYIETPVIRGGR
jgi:hypothetical protein